MRFIAQALGPEFDHLKIGELSKLSIIFHEQITEENWKAFHDAGEGAEMSMPVNGVVTITPGKPHLRLVEKDEPAA